MNKLILLVILSVLLQGCYIFTSLQSAKIVPPGKIEVTPSYSSLSWSDDNSSEKTHNNYGVQVAYGASETMSWRLRFERSVVDGEPDDFLQYIAVEPKFSIKKDKVAVSFPFGMYLDEDFSPFDEPYQVHPSLFITFPYDERFDFTVSSKYLIFFQENSDNLLALNFGAGIKPMITNRIIIRPEIGYLFNPRDEGHFFAWSIGISIVE